MPLGLLNRSEPKPKRGLLADCNIIASIALPRKAFFNTAQPTYILVLERRFTDADPRPDVFCAIARSTGETLDSRRTPTPDDNDLADIANAYVAWTRGQGEPAAALPFVKLEPASEFDETKRWDVPRFWDDDELVKMGVRVPPVERSEFMDEASDTLRELVAELEAATNALSALVPEKVEQWPIGDDTRFTLKPGKRVRHQDVLDHPGDLPVLSCFTRSTAEKGRLDERWAWGAGAWIIDEPTVTVNATGASGVGIVFLRESRAMITDDVIAVIPNGASLDPQYLAVALASVIAKGDFQYEAKLYRGRLKELAIEVPVDEAGEPDLQMQRSIGLAVARVEQIKERITDLGSWARQTRLV